MYLVKNVLIKYAYFLYCKLISGISAYQNTAWHAMCLVIIVVNNKKPTKLFLYLQ